MEIWKAVPGYEDLYEVSNYGRVRSADHYVNHYYGARLVRGKLLKPQLARNGYLVVSLGRKDKHRLVHRLVAEAFLPREKEQIEVNHKNLIKTDNRVENLEWTTKHENMQHAHDNGAFPPEPHRKKVLCKETGKIFDSSYQAAEWVNATQKDYTGLVKNISGNIRTAIRKSRKAFGYTWEHVIEQPSTTIP